MKNETVIQKLGNVISTIVLGEAKIKIAEISKDVEYIKKDVNEIKPDLKNVREKVSGIVPKVEKLWEKNFTYNSSPVSLNKKGKKLLKESGIDKIIDSKKKKLCDFIINKKPQTAYDVQELSKETIKLILKDKKISKKLKNLAYQEGVGIEEILFVGAIYLRDIALKKCGFKLKDIDN
jgi:hypothetical protein